ncbi:MAG: hypothetical protein J6W42_08830 [Bacteroidaceae bacterium]|nr:hypothetical protein [Bacteroidaceae bacterium]
MCLAHLRGYNPVVQSIDGFDVVGGVSAAAAAIVVLLVCLHIGKPALPEETTCTISTAQILEGMEMLSKIQVGEIGSIVAEPQGDQVIITVKLTNGKERSYSMTGDVYGSSLSFTALN